VLERDQLVALDKALRSVGLAGLEPATERL
jgi:hypothetical protein